MSTYLTVLQFGRVAPEHRATLASLPAVLRLIETGTPDIALVGTYPEAIRDALGLAPRAIVVAEPTAISDADAARLLDAKPLVLPVLTLTASLRQVDGGNVLSKAGLVHSRLDWQADTRGSLLEHLAGLTSAVGNLTQVRLLSQNAGGYVGSARTSNGVEVNWSGLAAAPISRYELDIVGLAERLEVRADLDGSARPMTLRRAHAGGLDQPVGVFETGLRLFWRRAVDALTKGEPVTDWQDFVALRETVGTFASLANVSDGEAA